MEKYFKINDITRIKNIFYACTKTSVKTNTTFKMLD